MFCFVNIEFLCRVMRGDGLMDGERFNEMMIDPVSLIVNDCEGDDVIS